MERHWYGHQQHNVILVRCDSNQFTIKEIPWCGDLFYNLSYSTQTGFCFMFHT